MIQNLDVFLWNRKVRILVAYKERNTEKICFYFDSDFIKGGYDIAPLQASINGVSVQLGLPVYAEGDKIFGGLPSFIADSLPDHWANMVFNEWAKTHYANFRSVNIPIWQHKNSKTIEKYSIYCLLKTDIVRFTYDFKRV